VVPLPGSSFRQTLAFIKLWAGLSHSRHRFVDPVMANSSKKSPPYCRRSDLYTAFLASETLTSANIPLAHLGSRDLFNRVICDFGPDKGESPSNRQIAFSTLSSQWTLLFN